MNMENIFAFTVVSSRYLLAGLAVLVLGSCVVSLVTRQFGSRVGSYLVQKRSGKRLPLTHWENAIGRSNTCDVVLDVPTVSRFHAVISKRRKGWVVADTNSRTGVFVNGEKIEKQAYLKHGDTVAFGAAAFEFVDADVDDLQREQLKRQRRTQRQAPKQPQAHFIPAIIDEAGDKAYIIGCDSCTIGTQPGCDIRLRYAAVSPKHARIFTSGNSWYIEDIGSQTGTKVNARSIGSNARRLRNGDIVGLGGVVLVFDEHYKIKKNE